MNEEVARYVYHNSYGGQMEEEQFFTLLQKGLEFAANNPTDKLFINRFYKGDDLKAVNIALEYNQELMIRLLMQ